ncbi:uncharacterized protein J3R85_014190 [Psidium guajava]|nr:uncharacterized protein J3R85_014190 [Psidium guajava]
MTKRSRPPRIPDNNSINEEVRRLKEALKRMKEDRDHQVISFLEFREEMHKTLLQIDQMTKKSKEIQKLLSEKLERKLAAISRSELHKKELEDKMRAEVAEREKIILELRTRLEERDKVILELQTHLADAEGKQIDAAAKLIKIRDILKSKP